MMGAAMTILARLDPRRRFAAAIGWAVFVVVATAALITAQMVADDAQTRAVKDAREGLIEYATQVRDAMSLHIEWHRALLLAAAAAGLSVPEGPASLTTDLASLGRRFPEFSWLGVADAEGRVIASAGAAATATAAEVCALVADGAALPLVSDARAHADTTAAGAARVLRMAVALDSAPGHLLIAELPWAWVQGLLERMRGALEPSLPLEVLVTARDGRVLLGPPVRLGRPLGGEDEAADRGQYLVGSRSALRLADGVGLGWTAFVRAPADRALEPVRALRRTIFGTVLLTGLLAAFAAVGVTQWATRRLRQLAAQAEQIRLGLRLALTRPPGEDEVARIGATIGELIDQLQRDKGALVELNRDLDARVAERTARIEHMADEARHAAVTRERLRIARDLHDTLAHSLMALLTQIRLARKLRARLSADELDAELARAEQAAAEGLAESRSAIRSIRASDVRDTGLGPALEQLARRFTERSGIEAGLCADAATAAWADERAEVAYRIAEEALRNVERHAQAGKVTMTLRAADSEPAGLVLEIADDGRGFDPSTSGAGRFGLTGMREQAQLIGARLDIRSVLGHGTRVMLNVDAAA